MASIRTLGVYRLLLSRLPKGFFPPFFCMHRRIGWKHNGNVFTVHVCNCQNSLRQGASKYFYITHKFFVIHSMYMQIWYNVVLLLRHLCKHRYIFFRNFERTITTIESATAMCTSALQYIAYILTFWTSMNFLSYIYFWMQWLSRFKTYLCVQQL